MKKHHSCEFKIFFALVIQKYCISVVPGLHWSRCACILHVRESSRCVPSYALRIRGGWRPLSWAAVRPAGEPWRRRRPWRWRSPRRPRARSCRRCRPPAAAASRTPGSCHHHTQCCPLPYPARLCGFHHFDSWIIFPNVIWFRYKLAYF